MKSNKVKAFTLSEILVVLVVASIVIVMAFLVLNMVRKQVVGIQNNYAKKQISNNFETLLQRDFNSNQANYKLKTNTLVLKNTKDSIIYTIPSNFITRDKDTFEIAVENKKLFLEGVKVKNNQIDALELNLSASFGNRKLFFFQKKDAAYYINN